MGLPPFSSDLHRSGSPAGGRAGDRRPAQELRPLPPPAGGPRRGLRRHRGTAGRRGRRAVPLTGHYLRRRRGVGGAAVPGHARPPRVLRPQDPRPGLRRRHGGGGRPLELHRGAAAQRCALPRGVPLPPARGLALRRAGAAHGRPRARLLRPPRRAGAAALGGRQAAAGAGHGGAGARRGAEPPAGGAARRAVPRAARAAAADLPRHSAACGLAAAAGATGERRAAPPLLAGAARAAVAGGEEQPHAAAVLAVDGLPRGGADMEGRQGHRRRVPRRRRRRRPRLRPHATRRRRNGGP